MGIANFVEAALLMHRLDRLDVALALASSVVDATARRLYPEQRVGERYKAFLQTNLSVVTRIGFPGIVASSVRIKCGPKADCALKPDADGYVDVEEILYHTVRCGLVHECDIDEHIGFTPQVRIGDFADLFEVPTALPIGLLAAAVLSPVNKNETASPEASMELLGRTFQLNQLWGKGVGCLVAP